MCNADGCEGNADADADADTTSVSSGNETTRFNLHLPEFFLLQIYREASVGGLGEILNYVLSSEIRKEIINFSMHERNNYF